MHAFMTGLWILVGILAGTVIEILVREFQDRRRQKRQISAVIKELQFNLYRVDLNIEWLKEYQGAIAADNPARFLRWFSLTSMLSVVTNQLLQSGKLYDLLSTDEVIQVQGFFSFHSAVAERSINDQAAAQRLVLNKQQADMEILFWRTRFDEQRKNLVQVIKNLEELAG